MSILSYRFKAILNFQEKLFIQTDKFMLKFTCEYKRPRMYKTILKKNKLEGLQYLTPRIIKSTSNQSCVALAEDTQLNQ